MEERGGAERERKVTLLRPIFELSEEFIAAAKVLSEEDGEVIEEEDVPSRTEVCSVQSS